MINKCVKTAASKLFEKNTLNSVIVRTSRVFNPTLIHVENKLSVQVQMLGLISANIGDNAYEQYEDLIKSNFDSILYKDGDRLDNFFFQTLKIERFPALAHIAMIIFVISHGQADFEKGLSINHSNKKRKDSLETWAACS